MKTNLIAALVILGLTAGISSNAAAQSKGNGIRYDFAEARFVDVDGGDGIEIAGSFKIDPQIYLFGGFQDLDNIEVLEIGGGFILPKDKIDFAVEFAFLDAEAGANSDTGFSLSAGGRGFATPELELRAYARHVDVFNNSDTFIDLGADYFIGANLSVGVTLEVASDADTLTFGGRFYF